MGCKRVAPTCTTGCGHCEGNHEQVQLGQPRGRKGGEWFATAAETEFLLGLLAEKDATSGRVQGVVDQLAADLRTAADAQFSRSLMISRVNALSAALGGQEGRRAGTGHGELATRGRVAPQK